MTTKRKRKSKKAKITNYVRRFVDRRDKKEIMRQCEDFHFRRHGAPVIRVVVYFIIVILFCIWLINNLISSLLFLPPNEPPPLDDIINILGIVVFAAFTAGLVAVFILIKIRENVLETEFQSLIFANGMRVNSDFCIVVHKEQTGFYCDYNFSEIFADFGEHHHDPFHTLIASEGFKQSDEDRMLKAMKNGEQVNFTFTLKSKNHGTQRIKVTLNPLERPDGFFLIQGTYV